MNIIHVRQISEFTANLISLVINFVLIWMVLTERNQHVKAYGKMIILAAISDYVYVLVSFISAESLVISNGSIIYISNGFFSEIDGLEYVLVFLFHCMFVITIFITPIEYYYRWHLVVRGHAISTKKLVVIVLIMALIPIIFNIQFVYLFVRSREESIQKYGYLLADPIYLNSNGQLPIFVVNSSDNLWFLINSILITLATILTYSVAIFFGLKTYQKLKSMTHLMSAKTLRLNRNMTTILVVRAISPLCLCTVPILFIFVGIVFKVSIPNLGFIIVIATDWIPVLSPLTTLLLLQCYRRRLISTFMSLFKKEGIRYIPTSTVHNNQGNVIRRQSVLYHVS